MIYNQWLFDILALNTGLSFENNQSNVKDVKRESGKFIIVVIELKEQEICYKLYNWVELYSCQVVPVSL